MPKTIRNKFDKVLTYENLMNSHLLSRKNKRCKNDIISFDLKQEEYIRYLYQNLKQGTYIHGGYTTFYVSEPKLRKIEKARYMDRIVHRWLVDYILADLYIPTFISTSYACIKGRGVLKAVTEIQSAMKHCKRIWQDYYILKMDISKYFQSVNKEILFNILCKKIKDEKIISLIHQILYSNKSITGIPIGNYTSQIFANIYLNEVDQYVKNSLKTKYYFRYMDDSILLVKSKEEAIYALQSITYFLDTNLHLKLNRKTQIFKSKQGVNFCGYKINEYRLKIRDRGKRNLKNKVRSLKKKIKNKELSSKDAKKFLSGHFGYIKHADSYNLIKSLFYSEKE